MAQKIQGITVEIGGDVTGLTSALKTLNKDVGTTQKELKEVERLLKLDPTNTVLLEQKQRLLSQSVEQTSTKLDALKAAKKTADEQMASGTEVNQAEYRKLEREIIATEEALKNTEKTAKQSNAALSGVAASAGELAKNTKKMAQATKGLSTIAGGILAGGAGIAIAAGKSADEINTLAKVTGLSVEQLQKFAYAEEIIDVSLDTMAGSMAKLTRNMSSAKDGTGAAAETFRSLGVSITDTNGNLKDNEVVFGEVIDALGKVENSTQRDALAMGLFGKSAQDLNPLILGGADALKELGEEAEAAGLILSQDALDSANEFNDAIDKLSSTTKAGALKIGGEFSKTFLPVAEKLLGVVSGLINALSGLSTEQLTAITVILAMVASLSPLLSFISKLSMAIPFLTTTVFPALSAAVTAIGATFLATAAIVFAFIAVIALFGDNILAVFAKVNEFLQGVFAKDWTETFGAMGEFLNGFFANLKLGWDAFYLMLTGIIDFIRGVFTGDWERAWQGIVNIFDGAFKGLQAMALVPINGIIALLNAAIDGVNMLVSGLNSIKIDVPQWVPGLGGKKLGFNLPHLGKIAYLANGGTLTAGNAIVGERGPELLSLINGAARVTPLTSMQRQAGAIGSMGGVNIRIDSVYNYDTATDTASFAQQLSSALQSENNMNIIVGAVNRRLGEKYI